MSGLKCVGVVLGLAGLFLIGPFVHADNPPWPMSVGESIVIKEYLGFPSGGPDYIGNIAVTDSSVWWGISRWTDHLEWRYLVRYDLPSWIEEMFWWEHHIRPFFIIVPDDSYVLFWNWAVEGEVDCLFSFHVLTQKLTEIYCVESPENPALEPDLDHPWLV